MSTLSSVSDIMTKNSIIRNSSIDLWFSICTTYNIMLYCLVSFTIDIWDLMFWDVCKLINWFINELIKFVHLRYVIMLQRVQNIFDFKYVWLSLVIDLHVSDISIWLSLLCLVFHSDCVSFPWLHLTTYLPFLKLFNVILFYQFTMIQAPIFKTFK